MINKRTIDLDIVRDVVAWDKSAARSGVNIHLSRKPGFFSFRCVHERFETLEREIIGRTCVGARYRRRGEADFSMTFIDTRKGHRSRAEPVSSRVSA